jgi:hypothetical protein
MDAKLLELLDWNDVQIEDYFLEVSNAGPPKAMEHVLWLALEQVKLRQSLEE